MLKIVIFVGAFLALTANGYNFKDAEFNQLILEDMQDFSAAESGRAKRNTEVSTADDKCHAHGYGKWKKDQHCCNDGKYDPKVYEGFREARQECYKDIHGTDEPVFDPFNCERLQKMKEDAICVGACIAKKFNMIDDKGVLKREAIVEHLKTKFVDIPWKVEAADGIVDKCLAIINKETVDTSFKCSPSAIHFIHCMWKEFINQCPKEMQNDSSKCQKLREKISKGDDEGYLKHVHFHRFTHHHRDHDHEEKH